MAVYTIRNEAGGQVSISLGFLGGEKPAHLEAGEVWVFSGYTKLLEASTKAAAKRFKCSAKDVKTSCIGEPS